MTNLSSLRLSNEESFEGVGLDSAEVLSLVGTGITIYDTKDSLPTSGLITGDQAFVTSNNRYYISNGTGWHSVALINLSPTMSLDQSGTITLTAESLSATVTITAQDSDNPDAILSYSVESDGNMLATGVTVSQDSSVFTITAISQDSGAVAGSFDLTFKVSDQINQASEALSFTLTFGNVVDSSAETILLIKSQKPNVNATWNGDITYQNSSDVKTGFTETGDPQASTFTPYRSGGYSTYFGGGNVGFYAADNAEFTLGTSDFCMEGWLWITDYSPLQMFFSQWATGGGTNTFQCRITTGGYLEFVLSNSSTLTATGAQVPTHQWVHYAFVRNGSNFNIYQDGVSLYSDTSFSYTFTDTSDPLYVGRWYGSTDYAVEGYMYDVRFVVGSPVYTAAFTPPTSKLENITNTKLLTCRLPYIADESTTGHTLTANGAVETKPFGPYDYEPWAADDHGGSVNFDGSDSLKVGGSPTWAAFGTGNFTIEGWIYGDVSLSVGAGFINTHRAGNASGWYFGLSSSNRMVFWAGSNIYTPSNVLLDNVWNHVAAVRSGTGSNQFKIYVNGKAVTTSTVSTDISYTYGPWIGSYDTGGTAYYHVGSIADLRVSHAAEYSADFTPPTAPLSLTADTKFLMNNKSDANIYDLTGSYLISTADGVRTNDTDRKFSTSASITFDGVNDQIELSNYAEDIFRTIGTGDFTIEAWIKGTSNPDAAYFFDAEATTINVARITMFRETSAASGPNYSYNVFDNAGGYHGLLNSVSNNAFGQWHHVAYVRYNGTSKIYFNGTATASWANTIDYSGVRNFVIGNTVAFKTYDDFLPGYMQDFRISNTARYTGNFTPPTAEFEL